jgi:hypothetical protein
MRGLAVLCVVLLAGCVPVSEHPAGDERAPFDARLQGVWRPTEKKDAGTMLFVGFNEDGGQGVHLVVVEETTERRWKVDEYAGITERRGAHGYLSIRYATSDGSRRGWVIARYTLVGADRLRLETLDEPRLAALVRDGTVAGRVESDTPGADVDLTLGSEELLAFLESPRGSDLFSSPHTLARVTTPGAQAPGRHQSTGAGARPSR